MKLENKIKREYDDDSLLPLVNIIFLLLIFFMIAGVIEKRIIKDGMIPKIENCFYALKNGVNEIFIGNHDIVKSIKNCTTLTL